MQEGQSEEEIEQRRIQLHREAALASRPPPDRAQEEAGRPRPTSRRDLWRHDDSDILAVSFPFPPLLPSSLSICPHSWSSFRTSCRDTSTPPLLSQ